MNIKYFILLLFVALVSACNEEGIATLVIEDGQPSVAKMIVGQWKPNHAEKADEDGNVIEDLDITDIPDLILEKTVQGILGTVTPEQEAVAPGILTGMLMKVKTLAVALDMMKKVLLLLLTVNVGIYSN